MTDENESFIREVDESLRTDKQLALLRRWGPAALGAFVALLVGLGGWLFYEDMRLKTAQRQADALIAAQEKARSEDPAGVAEEFAALTDKGPQAYRVMAMMERAGALADAGDLEAAVAGFDAAAEAARDPVLRDTARMRAAYIVADTQDMAALRARLDPMISAGGAISFLARELLGVEAWEAGDATLARETFENLNLAFDAPESVRQRAQLALAVIGPAPTAAEAPADASNADGDAQ